MDNLTIVRHAQASFLDEDYDRLSPLGERQSSALGDYWVRSKVRFHYAFAGPRKRHLRTAEIAGAAYRRARLPWPEPVILPELDEYNADQVIQRYLPSLVENHPHIRDLNGQFVRTKGTQREAATAELLFRAVTTMWVRQEFDCGEVETWELFCRRVRVGLDLVRSGGGESSNVVVFSSAGPTAVAMQAALELAPLKTLELSWLVRNCACSEFFYSGKQLWLQSFNTVPHLRDLALVSCR